MACPLSDERLRELVAQSASPDEWVSIDLLRRVAHEAAAAWLETIEREVLKDNPSARAIWLDALTVDARAHRAAAKGGTDGE